MRLAIDDAEGLLTAGDAALLPLAAAAARGGRYLPVDVQCAESTVARTLLGRTSGPRALGYGPARVWADRVTLADGRTLLAPDEEDLDGLADDAVSSVSWRNLPMPAAGRTVLGGFRDADAVRRAVAPLAAERPDALVAVELCDRVASRWLIGRDPGLPYTLLLRAEGATESVALAWRKAWQSVELAGGEPATLPRGAWPWGPVQPAGGPPAARLRLKASPAALPALQSTLTELGEHLGGSAVRAHILLGLMWAWLPAGPRLGDALDWLGAHVTSLGARLEIVHRPEPLP